MKNKEFYLLPLVIAFFIGATTDIFAMADASSVNQGPFDLGFFITVPVCCGLLLCFLRQMRIKTSFVVILVTNIFFLGTMGITFFVYEARCGYVSDMYGLIYIIGVVPAMVVGTLYGAFLANHLRSDYVEDDLDEQS
jgi:hypothetical protein